MCLLTIVVRVGRWRLQTAASGKNIPSTAKAVCYLIVIMCSGLIYRGDYSAACANVRSVQGSSANAVRTMDSVGEDSSEDSAILRSGYLVEP